jgi:hypothetical protein
VSKEDLEGLMDEELDDQESDADADSGSDNSAPPDEGSQASTSSDKRVRDLMSKWQTEQARANRLEQELQAARGSQSGESQQEQPADGGANEFVEFAREDARRRIFESDPRLAAYGLEASAISGSTLLEMKASFAAQKKLIEGIESRARQQVLQEHGLDPEVVADGREKIPGIAQMSDEEFDKFLDQRDANKYG